MTVGPPKEAIGEGSEVRFEGKLTTKDYRRAMRLHFFPRRLTPLVLLGGVIFFILLHLALISPLMNDEPIEQITSRMVPLLVFVVVMFLVLRWSASQVISGSPIYAEPWTGRLTGWGLELGSQDWSTKVAWRLIFKSKTSKDLILLYPNAQSFYIFPRRFFSSDADWDKFNQWVAEFHETPASRASQTSTVRLMLIVFAVVVLFILLVAAITFFRAIQQ